MVRDFIDTLIEEYNEAENMEELQLLTATNEERGMMTDELKAAHAVAEARINGTAAPTAPAADERAAKIAQLEALLAELKGEVFGTTVQPTTLPATTTKPPVVQIKRASKKYRLLKVDVDWTNKPQVHAVMRILTAHLQVGDVVSEDQIVQMMIANEDVLATRQGGKRIWDYYKGTHSDGLIAHGNVEVVA